tara:strand:+ start:797 stop:1144 length:348 start_codon:yes stop_codon:yes gene_type:complete
MKESTRDNLKKIYPKWIKTIRRAIINLYRPIMHDKSTSKFNQHPISYIMLFAFIWSAVLVYKDNDLYYLPFLIGWCIIPITWIYLKLFPQTWDEMFNYEKDVFRQIWKLPKKWKP